MDNGNTDGRGRGEQTGVPAAQWSWERSRPASSPPAGLQTVTAQSWNLSSLEQEQGWRHGKRWPSVTCPAGQRAGAEGAGLHTSQQPVVTKAETRREGVPSGRRAEEPDVHSQELRVDQELDLRPETEPTRRHGSSLALGCEIVFLCFLKDLFI